MMFEFTYEWVMSMAKAGLLSRGVPEEEADDMLSKGDFWLEEERQTAAKAEMLSLIDNCKSSIAWTENNFIPGPNTAAHIKRQEAVINELSEYVNNNLGGLPE